MALSDAQYERITPLLLGGPGAAEPPAAHLKPLDPGGCHRFRAEQQPGKCFGVGERAGRSVELDERRVGVPAVAVEKEPPSDEGVGDVSCVVTRAASGGTADLAPDRGFGSD